MTNTTLAQLIKTGEAPPIIDVRSAFEYQRDRVPGAIHIPFWAAPFRTGEIPVTEQSIVIYCEHGPRAVLAKALFSLGGVKQAVLLDGHMLGWRKAGLPIGKYLFEYLLTQQ